MNWFKKKKEVEEKVITREEIDNKKEEIFNRCYNFLTTFIENQSGISYLNYNFIYHGITLNGLHNDCEMSVNFEDLESEHTKIQRIPIDLMLDFNLTDIIILFNSKEYDYEHELLLDVMLFFDEKFKNENVEFFNMKEKFKKDREQKIKNIYKKMNITEEEFKLLKIS